jgi:hypothetical protein
VLSTGHYLAGAAELAVIAAAATFGGVRLRSRLLPGWSGAPAWLATAVLAVALLIGVAEVLGTVGLFDDLPLLAGTLAATVGAALWAGGERREGPAPPAPPAGRGLSLAAVAIAAVAVAHFTIGVRLRLSTGMTGFDSTWYHGPFAAGFAQSGDTFGIQLIAPQFLAWFYPQNSELLHGVGNVAFDRDLLSPLLNLGWLCGCLLAAWCIGRPYGAAPLSLAGVAVAINTGALADQAGEARNDLVAAFFLLAALALAVNAWASSREDRAGPAGSALVVIGLAAGLAAGTKLNYLLPAAVLVCALALIAPRGARSRALGHLALPAIAGCGYWYLRNLVHAGSPLPWIRHLGPIDLPAPDQPIGGRAAHSVLGYLTDGSVWSDWFLPGLHHAFGVLWPLLLAASAAGLVAALAQRREPALRVAGLTGAALAVAWLVAPTSASGPDGLPRGFESGLRYLAPAIAIGLALLPTAPQLRTDGRRWAVMAALAVTLPFTDASGEPWHSGYLAAAVAAGVLAAAAAVALLSPRVRGLSRRTAYAVTAILLLLAVAAGAKGQRTYLDNRYANPHFTLPGLDAAFRWARSVSGARIGTTATREYPLLGTDLSNRVRFVGEERPHGGFVGITSCPAWRRAVNAGDYDYVVTSLDRLPSGGRRFAPQAAWTLGPQAQVVLRRAPTVVFRLHGPLDPAACPPGG